MYKKFRKLIKYFLIFLLINFHRVKFYFLSKNKIIKLDIGSGPIKGSDSWTTIDLIFGADICCNILNGIKLPSNSEMKYIVRIFWNISIIIKY